MELCLGFDYLYEKDRVADGICEAGPASVGLYFMSSTNSFCMMPKQYLFIIPLFPNKLFPPSRAFYLRNKNGKCVNKTKFITNLSQDFLDDYLLQVFLLCSFP